MTEVRTKKCTKANYQWIIKVNCNERTGQWWFACKKYTAKLTHSKERVLSFIATHGETLYYAERKSLRTIYGRAKSRIFVLPSQEKCLTLTVRATHLRAMRSPLAMRLHKKTSFCEALTLGSVVRRVVLHCRFVTPTAQFAWSGAHTGYFYWLLAVLKQRTEHQREEH